MSELALACPVWSAEQIYLHNLSAPIRDVMRFRLVYQGELSASANKSKTPEVSRIRTKLSPQLEFLWQTHNALQVLANTAFVENPEKPNTNVIIDGVTRSPREIAQRFPRNMISLCAPLQVGAANSYTPLIRKSLNLNCELSVLFLRQEDPGMLVTQGGDLDGRIKTLLDALRMPSKDEQQIAPPPNAHEYCLMEQDALVSALNVETDRLLFPATGKANEVCLVIEVSVVVLRVVPYNVCLV